MNNYLNTIINKLTNTIIHTNKIIETINKNYLFIFAINSYCKHDSNKRKTLYDVFRELRRPIFFIYKTVIILFFYFSFFL